MKPFKTPLIAFDVEADGPVPGLYSMVSFGLVDVFDPTKTFYAEIAPISSRWIPEALAISGFSRTQHEGFEPSHEVMATFLNWFATEYPGQRIQGISDNPAFDWSFLSYYIEKYFIEYPGASPYTKNPMGHSARRLGDLYSGYRLEPQNTSGWKKHAPQAHTHNALDDARKIAQGTKWVLEQIDKSGKR